MSEDFNDQEFENFFRERFQDYRSKPPARAWNHIQKKIPAPSNRRWLIFGLGILLLGAGLGSMWLWPEADRSVSPQAYSKNRSSRPSSSSEERRDSQRNNEHSRPEISSSPPSSSPKRSSTAKKEGLPDSEEKLPTLEKDNTLPTVADRRRSHAKKDHPEMNDQIKQERREVLSNQKKAFSGSPEELPAKKIIQDYPEKKLAIPPPDEPSLRNPTFARPEGNLVTKHSESLPPSQISDLVEPKERNATPSLSWRNQPTVNRLTFSYPLVKEEEGISLPKLRLTPPTDSYEKSTRRRTLLIGMGISPVITYYRIRPNRADDRLLFELPQETNRAYQNIGWRADFNAEKKLNTFLSGRLALTYTRQSSNFTYAYFERTSDSIQVELIRPDEIFVQPFSLKQEETIQYTFTAWGAQAGLYYQWPGVRNEHHLGVQLGYESIRRAASSSPASEASTSLSNSVAAFGVSYRLVKNLRPRWQVQIEPYAYYYLGNTYQNSSIEMVKPYLLGLRFGVAYRLW